ncbi:hypothetical protein [Peribacillus frigoritolerans]|uniref:hypothetical protein n=1 Tax=Peribacillus frigoritolerans TaxID=450367 RepID=UPI00227DB875|nr:hypothetical protein [Peribacillus frigoritolerans]MCY9005649.1 hypothetical protein [Peribacillus frigoritolerans]
MYNYNYALYPYDVPYFTEVERIPYQFDHPYNIMPTYYQDRGYYNIMPTYYQDRGYWDGHSGYPIYQQITQDYESNYHNYLKDVQGGTLDQRPIIIPDSSSGNLRNAPVKLAEYWATKNPNFRKRCGCDDIGSCSSLNHGESYATVGYRGVGRGKYRIQVQINHNGKEYYGAESNFEKQWYLFKNSPHPTHLFKTNILFAGADAPGREGYFRTGDNNTSGRHTGTLGLEVFDKHTNKSIFRALYFFENGFGNNWGDQWLRCGHDFYFIFEDS